MQVKRSQINLLCQRLSLDFIATTIHETTYIIIAYFPQLFQRQS